MGFWGFVGGNQGAVLAAGFACCAIALLIILSGRLHCRFSHDDADGVQHCHLTPVPRIGGVAIYLGCVVSWLFAKGDLSDLLGILLIAGSPVFLFGLLEDCTKCIGVKTRLAMSLMSGVIAYGLTGIHLTDVDIWGLNNLLTWLPFSIAFTVFAIAGVANAFNVIDGFNGLLASVALIIFSGLGAIAWGEGDTTLTAYSLVGGVLVLGFLVFNWPWGKLFMGDGGAYFLGFSLAWASILLVERHQEVTPFVMLLLCFHPIWETLFSIFRRLVRGYSPGRADNLHLHSLVFRRYVRPRMKGYPPLFQNSVTGLLMGSLTLPPMLIALVDPHSVLLCLSACFCFSLGYTTIYARIVRFSWCSPIRFLFDKRPVAKKVAFGGS